MMNEDKRTVLLLFEEEGRLDILRSHLASENIETISCVVEENFVLGNDLKNRTEVLIIELVKGSRLKPGFLSGFSCPVIILTDEIDSYNDLPGVRELPVYACMDRDSKPENILATVNLSLQWSAKTDSERKYEILVNAINEGVYIIDFEGNILEVNDNAARALGYSKEEIYEKGLSVIDATLSPEDIKNLAANMTADEVQIFETAHTKRSGEKFPVEVISSLVRYSGKNAIVSMARDITRRKEMEAALKRQLVEKEVLIKAIHHRIKNNIMSVKSLLSFQQSQSDNQIVNDALSEAMSRVQCMHVLYENILSSDASVSVGRYLETLLSSLMEMYEGEKKITVHSSFDDIELEDKKIFPLGVIFEELVTNIFKYAFTEKVAGTIIASLKTEKGKTILTVKDNGKGLPEDFQQSNGFGMMIMQIMSEQLEADFRIFNNSGTTSILSFPH